MTLAHAEIRRGNIIPELKASPIVGEINTYLKETEGRYKPYQPEYFMRHALGAAKEAHMRGDYGIGACILVIDGNDTAVYTGRNHMFTGNEFDRTHKHAETDSIKRMLDGRVKPLETFKTSEVEPILNRMFGKEGITNGFIVFGTLEPCQKCVTEETHLLTLAQERFGKDAKVASISANIDGGMEKMKGGATRSKGAANILGAKSLTQPAIWTKIQSGFVEDNPDPPVRFSLLHYNKKLLEEGKYGYKIKPWEFYKTDDKRLSDLCRDIFEKGRDELDKALSGIKK